MKGIQDSPICMVEDNIERRILWSAPSGENFSTSFRPPGSTRYSANRSKHLASVGIGKLACVFCRHVNWIFSLCLSLVCAFQKHENNPQIIYAHNSLSLSLSLFLLPLVPVTYAWKDELEKKTHNAITKALGQTPVPMSRQSQRGMEKKECDGIEDNEVDT